LYSLRDELDVIGPKVVLPRVIVVIKHPVSAQNLFENGDVLY
jgi:hypothetical protein